MSYIVEFDAERTWGGANWVYREIIRLTEPKMRDAPMLTAALHVPTVEAEKVLRLHGIPLPEMEALLDAARESYSENELAGPASFGTPEFFPGFMERFREFLELLQSHIAARRAGAAT
jgi:hypothetical protein